jgi:CAAX protease family protein
MTSVPPPQTITEEPPPTGHPAQKPDDDIPPWPVWTAPAAVALGFFLGQIAILLVEIVASGAGSSLSHPTPAVSLIGDFVFDLGFVAAALYFSMVRGHSRPVDFGYRRIAVSLGIKAFVLAGVGYYVVSAVYAAIFNLHGTDKLPKELGVDRSTAAAIAAVVFVTVIAPIAEEFFFRGFFFGALRRWRINVAGREIGTWVAAAITGIVFGLAHTGSAQAEFLVPLGVLGFLLCLVRWWTRSLYPCMALHSVNNALAVGVNQFHWSVGEILALIAGALLVIAALTGPLSAPRVRTA